jgi:hypothetical protein
VRFLHQLHRYLIPHQYLLQWKLLLLPVPQNLAYQANLPFLSKKVNPKPRDLNLPVLPSRKDFLHPVKIPKPI